MSRSLFMTLVFVLALGLSACADQVPTVEEFTPVPESEEEQTVTETVGEEEVAQPEDTPETAPQEEGVEAYPAPQEEGVEAYPAAEDQAEETPAGEIGANDLTGVIWNLTNLNGNEPPAEISITAEFSADGAVGGSSGCNRYTAGYTAEGSSITFDMSAAAMTMMACPEPVMALETEYIEALAAAATFEVSAGSLTLFDANGDPVAVFEAVSQELAGSTWEVIGYNNGQEAVVSVIIDTQITAQFDETGSLSGSAGCNNYSGSYETDGENITMGPFITTFMACAEPEGIMEQETQYLAALETAATYTIDGLTMNMRTADGATVANFTRITGTGAETAAEASELALTPAQIGLDTSALGTDWRAVAVAETAYDESMPPGPMGMPAHIEILFGDTADPSQVSLSGPVMYIIPVDAYRQLWDDAGNEGVTRTIDSIQALNFEIPDPAPTSGYPALPYEQAGAGVNDLAVQVGRAVDQSELNTTSATQDGYRFVGRWSQDATPVSNNGLRYLYQGFSNDGLYLVSFWWPVSTGALPTVDEMSEEDMEAFSADPSGAISAAAGELNALAADEWQPSLADLDAVVASLTIDGVPAAGLVDKTWQWIKGPSQPGSPETVTITDPSLYQATYDSSGRLTFQADCNNGSMPYELSNAGMTGSMATMPGPVTLAECGPESYYVAFIASLQAAEEYRIWAGGSEMELVLPGEDGVLLLRDAATEESPPPTTEPEVTEPTAGAAVSGTVTHAENAPIPDGATATIQIQDTSLADAAATVIGEQVIAGPGPFPFDYEVSYDPGEIIDNHTYTMSVRIESAEGSLLFINDTAIMVITNDSPTGDVTLPVITVGG